ncbi:MAG TPA: DUF4384 domain-containing protein [Bryobacteraceae bacterium]|nr:DUF4384 domain-containing protein [Bryobacteraceae bacterium]
MIRNLLPQLALPVLFLCSFSPASPQARKMNQGPHRMEITLERFDLGMWHAIDPSLVLAEGDRLRFRYRTNFDGYLYVTNQTSSGKYEQLFPLVETGQDNRIASGKEYQVPATAADFRVAGPAGYEVVYFLVTPSRISAAPPRVEPVPPDFKTNPPVLIPRCDDTVLKARGDCIDHSAGPNLVPRGVELPQTLADAADQGRRDLLFMRQNDKAVISSPAPLTGPVIYEFRLAHK